MHLGDEQGSEFTTVPSIDPRFVQLKFVFRTETCYLIKPLPKFGQFMLDKGCVTKQDGSKLELIDNELLSQCFVASVNNPSSYGLTCWLNRNSDEADTGVPKNASASNLSDRVRSRAFNEEASVYSRGYKNDAFLKPILTAFDMLDILDITHNRSCIWIGNSPRPRVSA